MLIDPLRTAHCSENRRKEVSNPEDWSCLCWVKAKKTSYVTGLVSTANRGNSPHILMAEMIVKTIYAFEDTLVTDFSQEYLLGYV